MYWGAWWRRRGPSHGTASRAGSPAPRPRWARFWKVMLPAASPQIVTGLRVSLAIALILVTTSEMVVSNDGLGFYVLERQRSFQMPEMYAGIVALALIGYGLNRFFLALDGWAMAWHKGL